MKTPRPKFVITYTKIRHGEPVLMRPDDLRVNAAPAACDGAPAPMPTRGTVVSLISLLLDASCRPHGRRLLSLGGRRRRRQGPACESRRAWLHTPCTPLPYRCCSSARCS